VSVWLPFALAVDDVTGGNIKVQSKDYAITGLVPIVDQGKSFVGGYTDDLSSAYSGPSPCVIFGDHTKILKYVDFRFALGADGVKVLVPKTEKLHAKFLYHYLRSRSLPNAGYSRHFKFLKQIQVPVPPFEEQRRVVALLDRAAEIRRRADAARAKARAIIPALFLDMFGDRGNDWRETTIEDILANQDNAIRTGPFGSQLKHSEFTDEGVPVLGIDNVVDNEFKWAKPRHLPLEKYERFKRYRVFPGDVVVTIMGTTGRVCVAPDDLPECMNTKHLCAFTLDRSRVHPRFIWGALVCDPSVRAQARGKANGQIMEGWNMGIVRSMRLPLPPLALQTAFAEQAQRIEATARALDAAGAKAEAMAAALSAKVFG
jgi:type I restriction enzyme S subunit